jgi:hypothetical protein
MPNPKAVAEIPYIQRDNIDLQDTTNYEGDPSYQFQTQNNRNMRLLLDVIELKHIGTDQIANKTITVYHRALPPQLTPAPAVTDWDFQIATYTGVDQSVIINESDFARIYFYPGDSLIVVWDAEYDTEVNISVTWRQV